MPPLGQTRPGLKTKGQITEPSILCCRQALLYGLYFHGLFPTAHLFDIGNVGVFLALEDCVDLFQSLAFGLDPVDSLVMCEYGWSWWNDLSDLR